MRQSESELFFDVDDFDFARFTRVNCMNTMDLLLDFNFRCWSTVFANPHSISWNSFVFFRMAFVELMSICFIWGTVSGSITGVRTFSVEAECSRIHQPLQESTELYNPFAERTSTSS